MGGGVSLYIHESLEFDILEDSPMSNLEAIVILIRIKKSKPIMMVNWYRPPNSKPDVFDHYEQFLQFTESLECHLLWGI